MEELCSSVTKRKDWEDCYSLLKDELSSFCTACFKPDPQGNRNGGGRGRGCKGKWRAIEQDLKEKNPKKKGKTK